MLKPIVKSSKITDHGWNQIFKELNKLNKMWTLIGLFAASKRKDGQISNGELGLIHEFGVPQRGIPQRSWMRSWFDSNISMIEKWMEESYLKIVDRKSTASRQLKILGEKMTTAYKKSITDLKSPGLKLTTILKKKSSSPLIDTAEMRNAVTHKEGKGRVKE